ncbi:MAG: hypothetical protein RLZZ316_1355 [Bacteroidota bacterium]|jgi:hypothetical protein
MAWFRFKKKFDFTNEINSACIEFSKECGYKPNENKNPSNLKKQSNDAATASKVIFFKSPRLSDTEPTLDLNNLDTVIV